MAASYDVSTYLLDKENIRDTVIRMASCPGPLYLNWRMFAFDDRATSTLIDHVYAPVITLSYDKLLLGDDFHQKKMPSEQWAKSLEHMHDKFDTTEHIIQNLLVELPQPGSGVQRPKNVKARAIAHGLFYKRDAEEGRPSIMALRNGGSYQLELVRIAEKENKGENPWRISLLNVTLDWQDRPNL
ncbi:a85abab4-79ca-4c16-abac-08a1ebe8aeba [Triangularia setosa]|uniref:A85abab4-79ca-4c16-abac-08a1ebe8aeba n=1 Tax=Triangularia setosa TaxID=2587417 RepID=A0AAN6W2F5_9PEZI|nr:a85abab4-79ca-4c16-abac-08a1ebe8aeba [Podospora setosa]